MKYLAMCHSGNRVDSEIMEFHLPPAQWTHDITPLNIAILIYKVGIITPNLQGDHNDFKRSFVENFILQQTLKNVLGTMFITDVDKTHRAIPSRSFQRKINNQIVTFLKHGKLYGTCLVLKRYLFSPPFDLLLKSHLVVVLVVVVVVVGFLQDISFIMRQYLFEH